MILRKPYAFLIKNFKIIHLILSIIMIYVVYKMGNISGFINDYINNIANTRIATSYIGGLIFLATIVIIGISVSLYILMKYKNKPKLLYLITSITYSIILIVLFYLLLSFQTIEKEVLDPKTIRLLRDIVNIVKYPEYVFIVIMLVRTLGFDIKRFDFKSDIEEMNIDVSDNEEVELSVGIDTEKIKTRGRRTIREFKYYVLENKVFVYTIVGVILGIIVISLIVNINFINKVYKEGDNINTSYFTMNIVDSYITSKKDNGDKIIDNDTSFVIIRMNVKSLYDYKYTLDTEDFLLVTGGNTYIPVLKYYDYFKLIGNGYKNQKLSYDETKTYILVYNIPNSVLNKSKIIRYEEGFEYVKKKFMANTKKIRIKPENLDKQDFEGDYKISNAIDFNNSLLKGSLKINSYEIGSEFVYNYNYCLKGNCSEMSSKINSNFDSILLKLDVESSIENYSNYEFTNTFIKVKYKKDDKEYTSDLDNKTPTSATSTMYLDVDREIKDADSIWLEINIRNKSYKYIIK